MKKLIAALIVCAEVILLSVSAYAVSVSAVSAVLIEAESGNIIYSKDENTRRGMASTTKIMTAIIAIENAPLDKMVVVPKEAVGVEGSSIYLTEGEKVSMETLLYALMLQSANDAAETIAYEIAGSIEAFADMMNKKA
ncbi:MAG: D-alanyl-D-alanine carboxypeptidase family protein, partial [Eubacteriales bacterium]